MSTGSVKPGPERKSNSLVEPDKTDTVKQLNNKNTEMPETLNDGKAKRRSKPKVVIQSLGEFIAYVYSRKGQKAALKPKVAKAICKKPRLDNEMRDLLLKSAEKDILLVVPRQLLLLSHHEDFSGYFLVKDSILEFVTTVLRRHPVFKKEVVQEVLLGDASPNQILRALKELAHPDLAKAQKGVSGKPLKSKAVEELRRNATYCLALWLHETQKHFSSTQLCKWLYLALWLPEASKIEDETEMLGEITVIQALSGVGLVCKSFWEEAESKQMLADTALKDKSLADEEIKSKEQTIQKIKNVLSNKDEVIKSLHDELDAFKKQHQDKMAHSLDDHESLRASIIRCLKADTDLLSDGLHALRRDQPLVRVMDDHAERVLESLRREIVRLTEGD